MGSKNGGPDQRRGGGKEGSRRCQSCGEGEGSWSEGEESWSEGEGSWCESEECICLRLNWSNREFGEAFSRRLAVNNDSDATYRRSNDTKADSNEEGVSTGPTVVDTAGAPRSV